MYICVQSHPKDNTLHIHPENNERKLEGEIENMVYENTQYI